MHIYKLNARPVLYDRIVITQTFVLAIALRAQIILVEMIIGHLCLAHVLNVLLMQGVTLIVFFN